PRYATDDNPAFGARREPFLPGPAAFERPNQVVQAAFAQAIAARKGAAAASVHDDIPSGRDADFDDSTDAESRAIARRFAPANVERPAGAEPHIIEMPVAERARALCLLQRPPPPLQPPLPPPLRPRQRRTPGRGRAASHRNAGRRARACA